MNNTTNVPKEAKAVAVAYKETKTKGEAWNHAVKNGFTLSNEEFTVMWEAIDSYVWLLPDTTDREDYLRDKCEECNDDETFSREHAEE